MRHPRKRQKVVILSTADYVSTVRTNKQHIADILAEDYDVIYVESIGLRRPSFSRADVGRITRRLMGRATKHNEVPPDNITVVRPRSIPFHEFSTVRKLNGFLLNRQLRPSVKDSVLWTFHPLTYDLDKAAATVVYQCVDLLHTFRGVPRQVVLEAEQRLAASTAQSIASSSVIKVHLASQGFLNVVLWENVADTSAFARRSGQRSPAILYAGNFTDTKVDFDLLEDVARLGHELHLAGPVAIDGTQAARRLHDLRAFANVHYHGVLNVPALADLANECTVGLIPYILDEHTSGIFPLKVFEYMAAGLAVASTKLPSLVDVGGDFTYVDRGNLTTVLNELLPPPSESRVTDRRTYAKKHSWITRRIEVLTLMDSLMAALKDTK